MTGSELLAAPTLPPACPRTGARASPSRGPSDAASRTPVRGHGRGAARCPAAGRAPAPRTGAGRPRVRRWSAWASRSCGRSRSTSRARTSRRPPDWPRPATTTTCCSRPRRGRAPAALRCEQLGEARRRAAAAVGLAEPAGWAHSPAAGLAYVILGAVHVLADDLAAGRRWSHGPRRRSAPAASRCSSLRVGRWRPSSCRRGASPLAALDVLRGATGTTRCRARCASPPRCSRPSCCWRSASRPGPGASWLGRMPPSRRRTRASASPG